MRAAHAQLRRLAARRRGLRRDVAGEDAADALDVELAEAKHLWLVLDGDAGCTRSLIEAGIAFFDDHTATNPLHKLRDLLYR